MELQEVLDGPGAKPELCKLGSILNELDAKQSLLLTARIEDRKNWSADKLAFQLKKTPYGVGSTTIKKHRAGLCGCYL